MTKKMSALLCLPLMLSPMLSSAATPVQLNHLPVSTLGAYLGATHGIKENSNQLVEKKRSVDFNKTTHIRLNQVYKGIPVWGGEAIVHVPMSLKPTQNLLAVTKSPQTNSSMNGQLYQNLDKDLAAAPQHVFTKNNQQKAELAVAKLVDEKFKGYSSSKVKKSELMVYVDDNNKAHYAYLISYRLSANNKVPAQPTYIVDAQTFAVYQSWNEVKSLDAVKGGGYGGNTANPLVYDGSQNHLAALDVMRDKKRKRCYLKNIDATVYDFRKIGFFEDVENYRGELGAVAQYSCSHKDRQHQSLYWSNKFDSANGGFSPSNDALYSGAVIQELYKQWYGLPMLKNKDGSAMLLELVTHSPEPPARVDDDVNDPYMQNAFWDEQNSIIFLGDGGDELYPLTSLGVVGHEVSHGFTQQHSNLAYYGQSGGMNESFSDMAAVTAEVFSVGKTDWKIGPEVFKQPGLALRYMDQPSKDCYGNEPGNWCSIDNVDQYYAGLDVHFTSGIYNRFFYLLTTSKGWNVKKAFGVMIQANSNYWTKTASYNSAACGVLSAAKDLNYDNEAIKAAFDKVGVNYSRC